MLSVRLDPELDRILDHDVDDLARYNILRYLHDHPFAKGDVHYFADELGLRSLDRVADALDALVEKGFLEKSSADGSHDGSYGLTSEPERRKLVERLYHLSSTSVYGEIVERLAARSLHRARKALAAARHRK